MKLLQLLRDKVYSTPLIDKASASNKSGTNLPVLLREIAEGLGMAKLAGVTRAFFYGRLSIPLSASSGFNAAEEQHKGRFIPMIQRIGSDKRKPSNGDSIQNANSLVNNKMRMTSAAIILFAILQQECEENCRDKACSEAMPVILSLLDDTTPQNQAIGALILIPVLKVSTESSAVFDKFHQVITFSLGNAVKHCARENATTLALLCLARSRWFELLHQHSLIGTSEIYSTVVDTFDTVRKQAHVGHQDDSDIRLAASLVTGVNPLLCLLLQFPEAAAIEVCRPGLSALLPLLEPAGMNLESRAIQIAALCGILSLIKGAYPIIGHHACKIMTGTFLMLNRLDDDAKLLNETTPADRCNDDRNATVIARQLAFYVAAATLAVSDKAGDVLQCIESEYGSKDHIQRCYDIRLLSLEIIPKS